MMHYLVYLPGPRTGSTLQAIFPTRDQALDWMAERALVDREQRYVLEETESVVVFPKPWKPPAISANDLRMLAALSHTVMIEGFEYLGAYQSGMRSEGDPMWVRVRLLELKKFVDEMAVRVVK